MINVTKPFLPPIEEYQHYLQGIWSRNWLTNSGPLVNELELKLKEYLQLNHILFLNNGTVALQIAIKALELKEEIITTPFSYVATTSSIVWENCTPVFVDINADTLNIDPDKIEAAITDKTTGILATHVYGNPCDVEKIQAIAKKHNLKVIYDAAHCFGTLYKNESIFNYGDISTVSFHATKLFHTVEGGAVFTQNPELLKKMALLRNFGHVDAINIDGPGINGKNSEFHAAMGLCNLKYIDKIIAKRRSDYEYYKEKLKTLRVAFPTIIKDAAPNYSYLPIIFESNEALNKSIKILNDNLIYPRRYFYPSLNLLNYVSPSSTPISENISNRVLCLPLFYDLTREEIDLIARLLLRVQNS
ncbi:DegT/DnrJ/EryC1/StrS family aminotransferase [Chitinophaga silvatica]|uniref:DegT/DnrJ/EryC1/StrS family aminotransferase n=1 Tax=Chitinophaga silvatica TaxID=2282649 RepID=A0A3E1YCG4_9BACT|nr:DegT/DnrJ/EryC1/StrS family aminotransferase [Chitinophaga silvatica]RFS23946.1 DegT/DnrJ/EryC1/StrS family aminotransferase [Chitinophaga silvatica]